MKTIPGVQSAGVAELIDLGLSNQRRGTRVEGYTPQQGEDMEIPFNRIGPGFLETMKISLVRGRSFSETDVKGRPEVAIINESFAKKYWPGSDPIGKRLSSDGEHWLEVVGVTRDGKYRTLGEQPTVFSLKSRRSLPERPPVGG